MLLFTMRNESISPLDILFADRTLRSLLVVLVDAERTTQLHFTPVRRSRKMPVQLCMRVCDPLVGVRDDVLELTQ